MLRISVNCESDLKCIKSLKPFASTSLVNHFSSPHTLNIHPSIVFGLSRARSRITTLNIFKLLWWVNLPFSSQNIIIILLIVFSHRLMFISTLLSAVSGCMHITRRRTMWACTAHVILTRAAWSSFFTTSFEASETFRHRAHWCIYKLWYLNQSHDLWNYN